MTLLPIVERELRVASRRRGTYGTRVQIAAAATLAAIVCFIISQLAPSLPFGKALFWGLSGVCLIYTMAAGRLMTADSLSREKRDGTLGLLFLTDLKGHDVVLGKLVATSLNGFYGLLAVFPILSIPLLVGGMTRGELCRMALVLVNSFLLSLAIGLFVSALCRDEHKTMAGNFILILLLTLAPAAFGGTIVLSNVGPMFHPLCFTCPFYSFWQCAAAQFTAAPEHFWSSLGVSFILTMALLLLACRIAPNAWQDNPVRARPDKKTPERARRRWREGAPEKANAFRKRLLDLNAYAWLTARPYPKRDYVWTAVALMGCWWILNTMLIGHRDEIADLAFALLLNSALKLWITVEAGHQLAQDKKSGAFELLLTTPLTVRDILRGQWKALRRQFLLPVILAAFVELDLLIVVSPGADAARTRWFWLAGIVMLLADAVTLGWVSMSAALIEKTHGRATAKTAVSILLLPWFLFGLVELPTYLWIFLFSRAPDAPDWGYGLLLWLGLGIFVDIFFVLRARRRLQEQFRQLGQEPAVEPPRFAWLQDWRTANPARKAQLRIKFRRIAVAAATVLALAVGAVLYVVHITDTAPPPPVIVAISQSNNPVRIAAGRNGFLFILPDGSLWRWIRPTGDEHEQRNFRKPSQVGTNRDWVKASTRGTGAIGLRSDGSLWAWNVDHDEPRQVGSDRDWLDACAGYRYSVALKLNGTVWVWGDTSEGQSGNGPGRYLSAPAQVGTNHDWKAISTSASTVGVLGLRADGTLWTWGFLYLFTNGTWGRGTNLEPVQVCRESNWLGFIGGFGNGVRNQTGESWGFVPFMALPGASVPVKTIGRIYASDTTMKTVGPVYTTNWIRADYVLKTDGTLWAVPSYGFPMPVPVAPPIRIGRRSDWIWVEGGNGTMIGLTSDGTLWAWGLDFGQQQRLDAGDRFVQLKNKIADALGNPPRTSSPFDDDWGPYQPRKEPRPLMRLISTNSASTHPP